MRTAAFLLALFAATGPALAVPGRDVYARASRTLPVRDIQLSARAAELVAARQFHPLARHAPLIDICANINTDAILGNSEILGIPLKDILGLDICLCISMLPLEIGVSVHLDALINQYGAPLVNAVLEILIDTSLGQKQCTRPEFSTASCSLDPCDFSCDPPFVKESGQCVCKAPYSLCNGECVKTHTGVCSSSVPRALARRTTLLADAQSSCKTGEQVCGVYGGTSHAYECVDTQTDLESCGGCTTPNPFAPAHTASAVGQDCSAIDGADGVSCADGRCVVDSCVPFWEVNDDRTGCTPSGGAGEGSPLFAVLADAFLPVKRDA